MFKCLLDVGEDLDADALPGCARAWVSCVCVCVCVRACVGARVLARPAAAGRLVAAESRVRCATPQCARARCACVKVTRRKPTRLRTRRSAAPAVAPRARLVMHTQPLAREQPCRVGAEERARWSVAEDYAFCIFADEYAALAGNRQTMHGPCKPVTVCRVNLFANGNRDGNRRSRPR